MSVESEMSVWASYLLRGLESSVELCSHSKEKETLDLFCSGSKRDNVEAMVITG